MIEEDTGSIDLISDVESRGGDSYHDGGGVGAHGIEEDVLVGANLDEDSDALPPSPGESPLGDLDAEPAGDAGHAHGAAGMFIQPV